MFLLVSVILLTEGVCLSACWDTPRDQGDTPGTRETAQDQGDYPRTKETPPRTRETPRDQGDPPSPPKQTPAYGHRAAGTHPTGMLSCLFQIFTEFVMGWRTACKVAVILGNQTRIYLSEMTIQTRILKCFNRTRLHSSRMHTARLLTISHSMHCTGDTCKNITFTNFACGR